MKLRIRSMNSKETIRIDAPEPCTLGLLKTLIGDRVGTPPDSLHFSLNRRDELVAASPDDFLQSVGLASGDLVFYSTSSFSPDSGGGAREDGVAVAPIHTDSLVNRGKSPMLASNDADMSSSSQTSSIIAGKVSGVKQDRMVTDPSVATAVAARESGEAQQNQDDMDMDAVYAEEETSSPEKASSFSIPGYLKRVLDLENGMSLGELGLLATAVHAVFLEAGFVVHGSGDTARLPEGWASRAPTLSISYTVPDLLGTAAAASVDGGVIDTVNLKLCHLARFVKVYGSIPGSPYKYCVSLSASKFVPAVASTLGEISLKDEQQVFQLWKTVKDELALRLLVDVCERNGLAPPPCFTRLPTDLKLMVLELLPGADLARVACVSSELKFLSSNDDLWKKKFEDEFGKSEEEGVSWQRWKAMFANSAKRRKRVKDLRLRRRREANVPFLPFARPQPLPVPFPAPRFPVIGGDYDLFPNIGGGFGPGSGRHIPRPMGRRNFSPNCNFGGLNF